MNKFAEKMDFVTYLRVMKKINEHIVKVVTKSKRFKYTASKFNI